MECEYKKKKTDQVNIKGEQKQTGEVVNFNMDHNKR